MYHAEYLNNKFKMKKYILLLVFIMSSVTMSYAQYVNIPDANFRKALIKAGVDKNKDGKISTYEAKRKKSLKLMEFKGNVWKGLNIKDLTGIEAFTELTTLDVRQNKLTKINVSKNRKLIWLKVSDNNLRSIDITRNTLLQTFHCENNNITSMNVSKNVRLKDFNCSGNKLKWLDISKNPKISLLGCANNTLNGLSVRNNKALTDFDCSGSGLTKIDISKNLEMVALSCFDNQIEVLDVSKNSKLIYLFCAANKLKKLDTKSNKNLEYIDCSNNNLTKLDVSKNLKLRSLECKDNMLAVLDLSKSNKLSVLKCGGNNMDKICVWDLKYFTENLDVDVESTVDIITDPQFLYVKTEKVVIDSVTIITAKSNKPKKTVKKAPKKHVPKEENIDDLPAYEEPVPLDMNKSYDASKLDPKHQKTEKNEDEPMPLDANGTYDSSKLNPKTER